jgi:hypothetical protein
MRQPIVNLTPGRHSLTSFLRRLLVLVVVSAVPIIFGVVIGEAVPGIGVGIAVALLGLPAVVLSPERDSRLSLKSFLLLGRWGSGGGPP